MTNPDYTHLALIVDRSGSMGAIRDDMEGAIRSLLEEQDKLDGTLKVDITTFDTVVEYPYADASVSDISSDPIIKPRGLTALLDAVGFTTFNLGAKLSDLPEDERPGTVIVAVVTDGDENASVEYTTDKIKELVTDQQDKYNWNFLFLGANIDSFSVAGGWGISKGSTLNFTASAAGTSNVAMASNTYLTNVRSAGSYVFTDKDREEEKTEA